MQNQLEAVTHNLTNIHGARTASAVLDLFDSGKLNQGDIILCHSNYRIRVAQQTRPEFYQEAQAIQSFICGIDPTRIAKNKVLRKVQDLSPEQCEQVLEYLNSLLKTV